MKSLYNFQAYCIFSYLHAVCSSYLQFNLSVDIIGVIYFCSELVHAVGIMSAGPITDKLVRLSNETGDCKFH